MAKFLTTSGTAYFIEQLIINATENLTLVTPYLQLSNNFIDRLSDADQNGIHITIIYGKDELHPNEWDKINNLDNTDIYFCQNLHAKCYSNDDSIIISSMNLYEYSEKNNREMSILINKNTDKEIYDDAIREIESIKNASVLEKATGDQEDSIEEEITIHPEYNESYNHHMPYLYKLLTKEFKNHEFQLNQQITAENFPKDGMRLEVDSRVDLKYKDFHKNYINNEIQDLLRDKTPASQVYFNNGSVNIYSGIDYNINKNDIREKANRLIDIIKYLYQVL
ncbi:phospholipase D family protein [Fodinibius salsisoli]|uniref:Phospholipase D family protein n=1 Tax=Fodinibius salsisoli TaxID=2820877 RepID=A0ABT3PJ43_9BACT|nr:phospholipase D family protein [Fodinibius salsisoli]MCW9705773.1 phospholipase D family protein [Fodinibius salsisoli]